MPTEFLPHITKHAALRMAGRGIKNEFLALVVQNADVETPVGRGATALRVSRKRAQALNIDDRLHRYAVILSAEATVVTILPINRGCAGRRYRRH